MEKGGEWGKPRPHGSTKFDEPSVIPDWASLPPELVQGIADCVLSTTGGVDAYMDMRAVCPSWRSAIAKPSPLDAVADLRFRPRHWVMVDLKSDSDNDDARLFLHGPTGRFRQLRLPVLRHHILVDASDGLLVLADRKPPHLARVLNPFTGDIIHFDASFMDTNTTWHTAVSGGSHFTLFLWRRGTLFSAAQSSNVFTQKDFTKEIGIYLMSMLSFQGNIYCVNEGGCVFKFVTPAEHLAIAKWSPDAEGDDSELHYLVESSGELLLIRYVDQTMKVFRVDVEHKLLEEVESLGRRALFLGEERCVSLDADKLPSVDGDCIYMVDFLDEGDMCEYNLRGGMVNIICGQESIEDRPFSLVQQLLFRYCDLRFHL
ncbi:uncharacterized protein LOC124672876 [Lolium rigidum]|uniref:uncharacterized protein LOC124672876 n=1 Tax=Lolium rigidum TaxID=89674 RepID=UPI001F5C4ED2|nr:uncharacterized protein LOC124672876 [Lolium rigidum]